jgi:hypothetical protein
MRTKSRDASIHWRMHLFAAFDERIELGRTGVHDVHAMMLCRRIRSWQTRQPARTAILSPCEGGDTEQGDSRKIDAGELLNNVCSK